MSLTKRVLTQTFNNIQPKPLTWLWHPRIPRGKITLLAGDPASGKTSLLLLLAAQLSNGTLPATNPNPPSIGNGQSELGNPQATLLLNPDDNAADTLRPRLDRLHANLQHIHTLPDFHTLIPAKNNPE